MQGNAIAPFRQCLMHRRAVVDTKVVQDHMNPQSKRVTVEQSFKQLKEQQAVLLGAACPNQPSAPNIQRAGQIAFLVLPGRKDFFLCSPVHPIQSDLGVQVDVHLVFVAGHFVGRQFVQQMADPSQTPLFGPFRPRAIDHCPRSATPSTNLPQGTAHGGLMHSCSRSLGQHLHQQFPGPGWPQVAILLRILIDNLVERCQKLFIDFDLPVVFTTVNQSEIPSAKASANMVNPRCGASQSLGNRRGCSLFAGQQHDLTSHSQSFVAGFPPHPPQSALDT